MKTFETIMKVAVGLAAFALMGGKECDCPAPVLYVSLDAIVADLRDPSALDIGSRPRTLIANYLEKRWGCC